MKIHTINFPHVCYDSCKFDCAQAIIRGTLVGEQCASTAVSGV